MRLLAKKYLLNFKIISCAVLTCGLAARNVHIKHNRRKKGLGGREINFL